MPGSFITPLLLTIWYHTTISISLPTLTNLQHRALTSLSNLSASEAWSRWKTWCWRSQSPKGTLFSITRCRTWHLLSGTQIPGRYHPPPSQLSLYCQYCSQIHCHFSIYIQSQNAHPRVPSSHLNTGISCHFIYH